MKIIKKIKNQYHKVLRYHRKYEVTRLYKIKKDCDKLWYGNTYGGFFVHPNLLNKESIVYSFGIGEDISFDLDVIQKHNCQVYGFDPTPKSINWIHTQKTPENFHFQDYGINVTTGQVLFHLPKNTDYVSGSVLSHNNVSEHNTVEVQMKSIEAILQETGHMQIDVLKMDIEGSEYDVIESILNTDIKIGQILIEFHERFFEDGFQRTKRAIKLLESSGYILFGVSESREELSFILK
ncbi:FkbM family methyltransferase [Winogradskyella sp.]|nr:FkbM family methyltransferase [Winogradskyella sp.]